LKKVVFGPRFVGEGIPQISDMHSQIALTSDHAGDFSWVSFSEHRRLLKRKEEDEEEERNCGKTKVDRRQLCPAA